MSASIILPIVMGILLLRVFWLKVKSANAHSESYKQLTPKDKLAVLKECLLNNPSEINLQNLKTFIAEIGLNQDVESYRPLMKQQLSLRSKPNALEEDNLLFAQESVWFDQIKPLEFAEAQEAQRQGDQETYIIRTLEGISRLYSDEAILDALLTLDQAYPKSTALRASYQKLMELRDCSRADDSSLETLRKTKDAWIADLLNYEP